MWNRFWLHLESMWGPFWKQIGVRLGSILGTIWGQFGVHGEIWQGLELQTPSGPDFWLLGPILGLFLGPMLGPCWAHVGPMLALVGRLGPSWRVLGAILSLS